MSGNTNPVWRKTPPSREEVRTYSCWWTKLFSGQITVLQFHVRDDAPGRIFMGHDKGLLYEEGELFCPEDWGDGSASWAPIPLPTDEANPPNAKNQTSLASCVLFALNHYKRLGGFGLMLGGEEIKSWPEKFMDALDDAGIQIDRKAFWRSTNKPTKKLTKKPAARKPAAKKKPAKDKRT